MDVTEPQIKESSDAIAICAGLAATWWRCSESMLNQQLRETRNLRFAGRLRGALADLTSSNESAILMVPIYQDWMKDILATLKTEPDVEEFEAVAEGD